jgi:hypothetical protein
MANDRAARKTERQTGKRKLFSLDLVDFDSIREWECFDPDSGKALRSSCASNFIPDFSPWKEHDQFEASFARLLNGSKADSAAGG